MSKKKTKDLATIPQNIPEANISPLVTMAMNSKVDADKMDKLMDLQVRYEEIQAEKEFNIAFAKFKQTAPIISKDSKVKFTNSKNVTTSYSHASLANLMGVVTPLLADQGLALYWIPSQENGQVTVTAVLTHVLGHSAKAPLSAPPDSSGGKNSIQAIKSTITYLERTTGFALLGLAESSDTDGATPPVEVEYITPDQVENLQFLINQTGREETELTKVICDAYKLPSLNHIQAKDFDSISLRITQTKS